MSSYRIFLVLLSLAFLVGCGEFDSSQDNAPGTQGNFNAVVAYDRLPLSTEGFLTYTNLSGAGLYGVMTAERNDYRQGERVGFCRKFALLVPNPEYSGHVCYELTLIDSAAASEFNSMVEETLNVDGSTLAAVTNVTMQEKRSADRMMICQRYSTLNVGNLKFSCFQRRR